MVRYNDETELTPELIKQLASRIRDVAQRYDDVAKWMEDAKMDSLGVVNAKSLDEALGDIIPKHLGALVSAYSANLKRQVLPKPEKAPDKKPKGKP